MLKQVAWLDAFEQSQTVQSILTLWIFKGSQQIWSNIDKRFNDYINVFRALIILTNCYYLFIFLLYKIYIVIVWTIIAIWTHSNGDPAKNEPIPIQEEMK